MKLLAAVLLVTLYAHMAAVSQNTAHHVYMRGNDLLEECSDVYDNPGKGGSVHATHCLGYVAGLIDGSTYGATLDACIPQEVPLGQIVRVITKYLSDHPSNLHLSAAVLIDRATTEAFPCKSK